MKKTEDGEALRRSDSNNVRTCWNCKKQDVLMITESIFCKIKKDIVYPWEATKCGDYEYD